MKVFAVVIAALLTVGSMARAGDLGTIDFPNSGSAAAQPHFVRGVLLLHSFQYADARNAFQAAQRADPGFALAYWGEAMTHNHGLWVEQDLDQARAAMAKLGSTAGARVAKAPTDREKGYLRAIEALFGEGNKIERDKAYRDAMGRLSAKYPEDLEAASFHALAILSVPQGERDFRAYMQGAAIVEEVARKNPQHPGAIHYIIHSYDDPIHAPLGLPAARVYAKIAPAATHALHMPSHIFLALGMWDDVVASNVASYGASKGLGYHSLQWLAYGYLQQGKFGDAAKMLSNMKSAYARDKSAAARWYMALMRAAHVIETRQWNSADFVVDMNGVEYSATAAHLFAMGWSAAQAGRLDAAARVLDDMKEGRAPLQKRLAAGPVCHQADFSSGISPNGLKGAAVMEQQLEGLILLARKKTDAALALLEQSAAAEDAMTMDFGPPNPVKPAHELLGEVLLELGKPELAVKQFELALQRAPGRRLSLQGLAKAATGGVKVSSR